jgi:type I restriction enzyme R subunit
VILPINGVPVVQIEIKGLGINPLRAMKQIVEYKSNPSNGYTKTLLCFMQLYIVSNRDRTCYFAYNNSRHFAFSADERFLPIYEFASEGNRKITHLNEFADSFLKKCDLGRTIARYMVLLAGDQKLDNNCGIVYRGRLKGYQCRSCRHQATVIAGSFL